MKVWKVTTFPYWEVSSMIKCFRAEFCRLSKSPAFWFCLIGMFVTAAGFIVLQATAMDYTVPISRVIFLPLTLWGMASAAFVSFFLGQDFSGGFVRCKLLSIPCRRDYVLAQLAVAAVGCGSIYLMVTLFTVALSLPFFEVNVNAVDFLCFTLIGLVMSMVQGCFFASLTLLCANQSKGILVTMTVSFLMLLLALHTNSILVQSPYKNGAANPHYVDGAVRQVYLLLHNLNPTGQAAQLSVWKVPQPIYTGFCSFLLAAISSFVSCRGFENKEIQ